MDDRALARAVELLETTPDCFVPLEELWLTLQEEGLAPDTDLDAFRAALLADERFEFVSEAGPHEAGVETTTRMAEEYQTTHVKLASREMTPQDIFTAMARSLARMNAALQDAWAARPEGDQDTEDQMLELLAAGQALEREIHGLIESHTADSNDLGEEDEA